MDNKQTIPPWSGRFSRPGNRYAIGDVHGCCRTLRAMVGDVLRLGPDDVLFLLGDYIDRGPDSKGVLDYLISLFLNDKLVVLPLMGNHEELCLNAAGGDTLAKSIWYGNGGGLTLRQFGVDKPEEIPQRYLDFMAAMPRVLTTTDYVFVHAGLDFTTEDPIRDSSPQFLLWDRSEHVRPQNIAGRTLVCGHTMTPLGKIRESLTKPVIYLDNGCYSKGEIGYGSLVALNLDTRELLVQPNCE